MPEPAEEAELDLYDIPAVYQERVLKFLTRESVALEITPAGDAFYVGVLHGTEGPTGAPSYSRSLEEAMNDAMHSRAQKKYISREFTARVHEWLMRETGVILLRAAGDQFEVTLVAQLPEGGVRGTATSVDEDLEVALVFAEDELDSQVVEGVFDPPGLPAHEALSENAPRPPRPSGPPPRARRPMSTRAIVEREEARTRREERPFDPEARREHYARPHHFAVNERRHRGIYAGTSAAEDDYVVYRHGTNDYYFVDHVERGGKHTLIGYARGYEDIDSAFDAAAKDAHQRGTQSAIVFVSLPDGELHQVGNTVGSRFDWPGQGSAERRRSEGRAWLSRRFSPRGQREDARYGANGHDVLREVMLGDTGYRLVVWDTNHRGEHGKSVLGYAFYAPGADEPLFEGDDFQTTGVVDSDETLRGILGFLTLRPGDTDREYFASYTKDQLDFAETDAEELQMFAMEPERDFEPLPLVDVA